MPQGSRVPAPAALREADRPGGTRPVQVEKGPAPAGDEGAPGPVARQGGDVRQARLRAVSTGRERVDAAEPAAVGPDPQAALPVEPQRADGDVLGQPERHGRPAPGAVGLAVEPRHLAARGHPQRALRDRLDRVDLLFEGRPDRKQAQPAVDETSHAPPHADPEAAPGAGRHRDLSPGQGERLSRRPAIQPEEPVPPDRPGVSALVQRKRVEGAAPARGADDGPPRASAFGPPHPAVRGAAVHPADPVDQQLQGLDRRERRREKRFAPSVLDAPEMPLLRQEEKRVRPGGHEGDDPVRGKPLVGRHVEDPEPVAVEARETAEGRQPQLAARQDDDVGDGVLGEPLRGRPLHDAVVRTALARRGGSLGGGEPRRREPARAIVDAAPAGRNIVLGLLPGLVFFPLGAGLYRRGGH